MPVAERTCTRELSASCALTPAPARVRSAFALRPLLLLLALSVGGLGVAAATWPETRPVPLLEQPMALESRMGLVALGAALLVHSSGCRDELVRLAGACSMLVLTHAVTCPYMHTLSRARIPCCRLPPR